MQSSLLASVLRLLSGLGSLILRAGFITFPWLAPFWPMMSQAPGRLGGFVNQIPDSVKSPRFPLCYRSEVGRGLGSVGAQSHHGSRRTLQPVAALPTHAPAVFPLHLSAFPKRPLEFPVNPKSSCSP